MHEALSLLGELDEEDARRLIDAGLEREFHRGDVIVQEGEAPEQLFIVLEGVLEAQLDRFGGKVLSRLGPGELVGELSFLEDRPASATVRAAEDGVLLAIGVPTLKGMLAESASFGTDLYRALGRVVSQRLRARSDDLGLLAAREAGEEQSDGDGPWKELAPVIAGFKELMRDADASSRAGGSSDEFGRAAHEGLDLLCRQLTAAIGDDSTWSQQIREEVGSRARLELHPYMLLTRIVERIFTKPRGYAGDFQTIEWMYRNEVGGNGVVGPLIDAAFLERPAARAVRNRRGLLAEEVRAAVERGGRVTSLACGPAEELFDVFAGLDDPTRLSARLIDIDLQALALVSDRRDREGLKGQMRLEQGNLVYLATGRQKLDLADQDLVYSIGLIDYFQDRFVIALLDWIHDALRPGGKVVLGNFHPANPDRALMDHILDWRLIHRDEADMNRLFEASKFGGPCAEIRYEPARVNLFAMAVRS